MLNGDLPSLNSCRNSKETQLRREKSSASTAALDNRHADGRGAAGAPTGISVAGGVGVNPLIDVAALQVHRQKGAPRGGGWFWLFIHVEPTRFVCN